MRLPSGRRTGCWASTASSPSSSTGCWRTCARGLDTWACCVLSATAVSSVRCPTSGTSWPPDQLPTWSTPYRLCVR